MRSRILAGFALATMVAACSGSGSTTSSGTGASTAAPVATAQLTAPQPSSAAVSVVCEFYPTIEKKVADAAGMDMQGENSASATRDAINAIEALADKATVPAEKKDLTALANAMDAAVMTGGSFSDWDPAFEAFHVKYGPACGQAVVTPAP